MYIQLCYLRKCNQQVNIQRWSAQGLSRGHACGETTIAWTSELTLLVSSDIRLDTTMVAVDRILVGGSVVTMSYISSEEKLDHLLSSLHSVQNDVGRELSYI